ncbi:glutamate ligase domain-containing protein, partial [Burkholderia pseudomallei]
QNLDSMGYYPYTHAVFGAMADKDLAGIVERLKGAIDHWHLTDLPLPRAAAADVLERVLRGAGVEHGAQHNITRHAGPADAFLDALKSASDNDRIVVFGSFYTVAGVMPVVDRRHDH